MYKSPIKNTNMSVEESASVFCSTASTGSSLLDSFCTHVEDKSAITLLGDRPVVDADMLAGQEDIAEKPSTAGKASPKRMSAEEVDKLKTTSQVKTARELAVERVSKVLKADRTRLHTS